MAAQAVCVSKSSHFSTPQSEKRSGSITNNSALQLRQAPGKAPKHVYRQLFRQRSCLFNKWRYACTFSNSTQCHPAENRCLKTAKSGWLESGEGHHPALSAVSLRRTASHYQGTTSPNATHKGSYLHQHQCSSSMQPTAAAVSKTCTQWTARPQSWCAPCAARRRALTHQLPSPYMTHSST